MKNTQFKLFILVSFLIMVFCSCEIYFHSPQPSWVKKNAKEFPKNLRGYYSLPGVMNKNGSDTILISENRIVDTHEEIDFNLSDSVLLKVYDHTYFLNFYEREFQSWLIIMAKVEKRKIIYYMIPTEDSIQINRLKEITSVKENKAKKNSFLRSSSYFLNPTSKEFKMILKENLFVAMDTLTRIK